MSELHVAACVREVPEMRFGKCFQGTLVCLAATRPA